MNNLSSMMRTIIDESEKRHSVKFKMFIEVFIVFVVCFIQLSKLRCHWQVDSGL
jgi:hypothetical protein